jgi:predicted membrane protein
MKELMSPKQTALTKTAMIVAAGLLFSVVLNVIFIFLTMAQIGILFCLVGLVILTTVVYDIELSKAKSLEELNKISKDLPTS